MKKFSLSTKRIITVLCFNYAIFVLAFFVLGSMSFDKRIIWLNFILDVVIFLFSLVLNILLFRKKYAAPLVGKITLTLITLSFGAFIYFAFLMPENGLPPVLFY